MTKKATKMAIAYDFDGTLSPINMQEAKKGFIDQLGIQKDTFWKGVKEETETHDADQVLVYMQKMLKEARNNNVGIRKEKFKDFGKNIEFFPGVEEWFDRINTYAKKQNINVEHYIISSGNQEIIEGTKIYNKFKHVYASKFIFDVDDVPTGIGLAVNYTTKTQFLFRINKGVLKTSDTEGVNKIIPKKGRAIPFENMVFIGDGATDIPCFSLLKDQGGCAIAVYKPKTPKAKRKVQNLVAQRVDAIVPANYEQDSPLDKIIKAKIDEISARTEFEKVCTNPQ